MRITELKISNFNGFESRQLDFHPHFNLLVGDNATGKRREQHCDSFKGQRDLSRNPANPLHRVEEFTRFEGNGRISSNDPAFAAELDAVLNLNQSLLVNNRKAVPGAFMEALPRIGPVQKATLERWLREWNGESTSGELRPFCQVVVYWIRKRLARS